LITLFAKASHKEHKEREEHEEDAKQTHSLNDREAVFFAV
jgi:hypothetical protein